MKRSYYTSENPSSGRHTTGGNPGWSVYTELWREESWDNGEPIDGSQEFVCSAPDEATADRIANALYHYGDKGECGHPVGPHDDVCDACFQAANPDWKAI